jgi:hypothetical protein
MLRNNPIPPERPMPLPTRACLALALAAFALAVAVSRQSGFTPGRASAAPIVVVDGPPQVVVATGSVEARVRWLEARVLMMQDRLDSGDEAR